VRGTSGWALALALAFLEGGGAGCGHGSAPPPVARGPLPPGVVARVGGRDITAAEVARIAAAQHLDAAEARDIAVRDTLLASGAEARGLSSAPAAKLTWEGDLARRVLRLASAPGGLVQPYGLAALRKVEMANANAVRKALASLEESELIVRRLEAWEVSDPFFRRWLQGDP